MEIVHIGRYRIIFRNVSISGFSRRGNLYNLAKTFGFLHGFLCPHTRIEVSGLLFEEVERYHAEFQTCTTSQEQHRIAFRNVK